MLVVAGLLFVFFNSLNWLTNHGKETTVPKLLGKKMKDAVKILEKQGFKIQIDSTFISYKDPMEVLIQEPEAGSTVKVGRTIFITVNRKTPPSIDMPNLVGLSFRNAMLVMQSYRLVMGDTLYRPDVAAGSILEQLYNGKPILAGAKLPYGSTISLVVGEGLYGEVDVPNLIGVTWREAKMIIDTLQLTANIVWEGTIDDTATAVIYMQQPEALNELDFTNKLPKGDMLDLRIMQSPSQSLLEKNQPGSKKLLGEINAEIDSINKMNLQKAAKDSAINKIRDKKNEQIGTTKIPNMNNTNTNKKINNDNEPVKKSDDNIKNEFE